MKIKMTRDSVVGIGEIEKDEAGFLGDASKSGLVVKVRTAREGDVVNLKEDAATRLIQLGSAKAFTEEIKSK
jgi:hypothetical protein